MARGFTNQEKMLEQSSVPVVNDAKLPRMDEVEKLTEKKSAGGPKDEMQTSLGIRKKTQVPKSKQRGDFMDPFHSPDEPEEFNKEFPPAEAFEPQKESRLSPEEEGQRGGYILLRLRVENGEIRIIGASSGEGPLLQEESVHGELGFEMRLANRRVALGSIHDSGEIRSFPPPYPTEEMQGHHIVETPVYEFKVRLPRQELTKDYASKLEIAVFRVKGEVDLKCLPPDKPVALQSDNVRTVARLTGVTEKNIAKEALKQINSILTK